MATCSNGEFVAESSLASLGRVAETWQIPLVIHWDLTNRCNLKCVHCYITDRRQEELSFEECLGILDQLVLAGTMLIQFSGGDIFVRSDALDILRAARARLFETKIITHGNHIDDAVADALARMGIAKVSMSLYSTDPQVHDAVTRIAGSQRKTVAAARRLIARDVAVTFNAPVVAHNQDDYFAVRELAESMGAEVAIDPSILNDDKLDFGLTSLGVSADQRILAYMRSFDRPGYVSARPHEMPKASEEASVCGAARIMACIGPEGELTPCLNWREPMGSLREKSFRELWTESPVVLRQREIVRGTYLKAGCDGCTFHGACAYCPGISHAETGQAGQRSEFVCEREHTMIAAAEHHKRLDERGLRLQDLHDPAEIFDRPPTFAERHLAACRAGFAQPANAIRLLQIEEPQTLDVAK